MVVLKIASFLSVVLMLTVVCVGNFFPFRVLCQGELGIHNLDTGLSYASIQEAIRANETLDGHTILVDAGFYRENVVVDKSVSLVPEGFGVIIDGGGIGTIFDVVADNVNVTGFIIQNSGMESDYFGIFLDHSSGCVISDNTIRSCYYGMHLNYAHNNTIRHNTFHNCSYGVWLAYSEKNLLFNNYAFKNEKVGFHLYPSSHNILSRNEAWNNEHGIYIYYSENNTVTENHVSNNTFGIWFGRGIGNTVHNNEAYNNTYGIRLSASTTNTISENTFDGNAFGISLHNSNDNSVFHNNFSNNTKQVLTSNSASSFDNGMEGNYWGDYDGFDVDNDCVGDTPYVIDANNTDRYPLMGRFFGFSEILDEEKINIYVISNCSVSGFEFLVESQMFRFRVSGLNGTVCFCRVMFPRAMFARPYIAVVDGVEVDASLLPISNISHAFLYSVFNMSSHEVVVGSRHFYTLTHAYIDLIAKYNGLLTDYYSLNVTYYGLLDNYTKLDNDLNYLQNMYDLLNSSYNDLVGSYEIVRVELGDVRLLMYGFLAATVVGVVVSLVSLRFGFKYYRRFSEQRRIIEAYGLSPLEVAQALFELDVKKRGEKIERFEEKYGVKFRPRGSLEDIIKSLKSKKKRRRG